MRGCFCRPEVFGFAQVGEWLKPTDCKSVPLRRYGGSNPPLCTRMAKEVAMLQLLTSLERPDVAGGL